MTGYIIYYQQEEEGGQRLSVGAEAAATNASITGLIAGATYSITMVATSSTLPSNETAALTVTIGTIYMYMYCIYVYRYMYIQCTCICTRIPLYILYMYLQSSVMLLVEN